MSHRSPLCLKGQRIEFCVTTLDAIEQKFDWAYNRYGTRLVA
jgi:hypothetical protein